MNVVKSKDAVRKHNDDENNGKHYEGIRKRARDETCTQSTSRC